MNQLSLETTAGENYRPTVCTEGKYQLSHRSPSTNIILTNLSVLCETNLKFKNSAIHPYFKISRHGSWRSIRCSQTAPCFVGHSGTRLQLDRCLKPWRCWPILNQQSTAIALASTRRPISCLHSAIHLMWIVLLRLLSFLRRPLPSLPLPISRLYLFCPRHRLFVHYPRHRLFVHYPQHHLFGVRQDWLPTAPTMRMTAPTAVTSATKCRTSDRTSSCPSSSVGCKL